MEVGKDFFSFFALNSRPSTHNYFPLPLASIPQISLGTAVLIIFAVCAGFVLLRGMTRMIVGTVVLGLSAWIGFKAWQIAPGLSLEWTGKSLGWINNGLPVAAFLLSFLGIRVIANAIVRPFRKTTDESLPRSLANMGVRLLVALVPTSLICMIAAVVVRHSAAVADVRASTKGAVDSEETVGKNLSQRLQSSVRAALPEKWLVFLDPHTDPSRVALAKLIASQSESPLKPVINPQTGKPIPRAIVVDDPALQKLAREGKFDTLLRHPLLTKALNDPKIQQLLRDLNL